MALPRDPGYMVSVAQGAAGTTTLATPADATHRIYVVDICLTLDAAGTLKFTEVAGDLTGPMSIAQDGGIAMSGSSRPILWTSTAGEALKITTATGKANGWITYFEAP